jgi:hypothetical protein
MRVAYKCVKSVQDSLEVTNEGPALLSGEEEGVEDIARRKLVRH